LKAARNDWHDVPLALDCVPDFLSKPIVLVHAAIEATRSQDYNYIRRLLDLSEKSCIEFPALQVLNIHENGQSPDFKSVLDTPG